MVVKVKKQINIMGSRKEVTDYIPELLLTRERRAKADKLDEEIKEGVEKINSAFDNLDKETKKNALAKWRWLGSEIGNLIEGLENLDQADVDNHAIWAAIGQYFREELKRGIDTKRSATRKDHYRKCWLLATTPDLEWITNWPGWDAFIDRGEQLVLSKKIMPVLKKKFSKISHKLNQRDYQRIAKLVTEEIPSSTGRPLSIDELSAAEIDGIVEKVLTKFETR